MTSPPCVHVIDDDAEIRASVKLMLASVPLEAETYADAQDFLTRFTGMPPGPAVALVDLRMPGMSGIALLERLRSDHPSLPVIMITGYGDIDTAVRAMKLGAADFITKPFDIQELIKKIHELPHRAPPEGRAAEELGMSAEEVLARLSKLTAREREVFERIVAGDANKVIASELGISARTVESHRARIMSKMGAKSVVDLVMAAMQDASRPAHD